ncbi:PEP-CTERM sorting domain-containing protein, partial [bacterium]|nr:PEP-CTERM sorting domain-containing protein [bacterium]
GDFDYDDMRFKVQFVGSIPPVVPEPVSTTLFLVGASVLGLRQLRSRKSKPLLQKSSETFVS